MVTRIRNIAQPLRRWMSRMPRALWCCFCALMVTALVDDLIQLKIDSQDYAQLLGGEASHGLWRYSSEAAYVTHGLVLTGWFMAGIFCALGWRPLSRSWVLPTHVGLTLVYLIYMQIAL